MDDSITNKRTSGYIRLQNTTTQDWWFWTWSLTGQWFII